MNIEQKKSLLFEVNENILLPDGLENAVIGWVEIAGLNIKAAISYAKAIQILMEQGMDNQEAAEFFEFNIVSAYVGENTPAYVFLFEDDL